MPTTSVMSASSARLIGTDCSCFSHDGQTQSLNNPEPVEQIEICLCQRVHPLRSPEPGPPYSNPRRTMASSPAFVSLTFTLTSPNGGFTPFALIFESRAGWSISGQLCELCAGGIGNAIRSSHEAGFLFSCKFSGKYLRMHRDARHLFAVAAFRRRQHAQRFGPLN